MSLTPAPNHRATPVTIYGTDGAESLGGVYNTTLPTLTNGQHGDLQVGARGALLVQLQATDSTSAPYSSDTADAIATSATANKIQVRTHPFIFNGTTWDRLRTPNTFKPLDVSAATAEATIWTPAAGKKFRLMGFILATGVASTLTFKDNTGGTTIFVARAAADTPLVVNLGNGILSGAADRVLTVTRGTSATLVGTVFGTEE
jgi:hypothetical protein